MQSVVFDGLRLDYESKRDENLGNRCAWPLVKQPSALIPGLYKAGTAC
jgi:hypothetical protein